MLTLPDSDPEAVAFSPDGNTIAIGTDRSINLYNAQTGEIRQIQGGSTNEALAFSPDGGKVASGSSDRTVRVWDMRSGRLLVTFMILPASQQGAALTDWIAFTPEGYYTGSPGAARFIRWRDGNTLFSAETYERVFHRPDLVQRTLQSGN